MSSFNFDNSNEGEWEDTNDLVWDETTWKQFLSQHEKEISKFQALYRKHINTPNRLDDIAKLLSWDKEEWNPLAQESWSEHNDQLDEENEADMEPFTVHRHPVFVVNTALFEDLRQDFESLLQDDAFCASASLSWKLASHLQKAEAEASLGIYALDLGDFVLAICHLKRALVQINHCFSIIQEISQANRPNDLAQAWSLTALTRLFDLRDVWLRVMNECRIEQQSFRDEE